MIDRRTFLESLGLIGASTLISCTSAPEERLYAYLKTADELIPGQATFYATVCRACPAGCGLWVRTREARPIKLEGNPHHPVNRGKLCARGQAFIQSLSSPARLAKPRTGRGEDQAETSWRKAEATLDSKLATAKSVTVISGLESGSLHQLMGELASRLPAGRHVVYEPLLPTAMATASATLFGTREIPRLVLDEVDLVVSLGADLLDSWMSPVEYARVWAERHGIDSDRALELDYVGARRNLTATAADHWHRTPAITIDAIAIAIAHGLFATTRDKLSASDRAAVERVFARLVDMPANVDPALVSKLVARLLAARRGVLVYGGSETATTTSVAAHHAVLLSNFLIGAVGTAWRFGDDWALGHADPAAKTHAALAANPDVVILVGVNPAYTLPGAAAALARASFVVAMDCEASETTELADLVLPIHHPLEAWGDYEVRRGVRGLMQPVRSPLHPSRHLGDVLMAAASRLGKPFAASNYRRYIAQRWLKAQPTAAAIKETGGAPSTDGAVPGDGRADAPALPMVPAIDLASDERWERLLMEGGQFTSAPPATQPGQLAVTDVDDVHVAGVDAALEGSGNTILMVPTSAALYDGRSATATWLLETPDSLTQTAWEIPVEVSKDVASRDDIGDGDRVQLSSEHGSVTARVRVDPELPERTLALRMGGGRRSAGHDGPGANVFALLGPTFNRAGDLALTQIKVKVARLAGGTLVKVSGGTDSRGRSLCLATKLSDYRQGRHPQVTRHGDKMPAADGTYHGALTPLPQDEIGGTTPPDNNVELQKHPDHRWGMVVDLDKCTGCGACAVACQAENNIPLVGADEVSRGRELSWIRIERHDFPDDVAPVRFLPVMCQHCDNAPCETVCPVFASYHTPDGLNAQIYNRCVGTRYCNNNCPYKARRFNYFTYSRPEPGNQQLNPDVTVRSRGVMEKCTMCLQRIRAVTNRAKADKTAIADGDIMTACQQTCPTGAITFGDYKQPAWAMSKLATSPRAYRLLDYVVNTRPGIVYLRKVETDIEEG